MGKADSEKLQNQLCPGFGQDRVNFHRNGQTTGIPYLVPSGWVLAGGERGGGNSLAAREHAALGGESGSLGSVVYVVFSPYLYRCCSCSLCLLFC